MKRKEEVIRQEAMEYAYRIVKEQGIEALEQRCRRNANTYIPSRLEQGQVEEFVNRTKNTCLFTFLSTMLFTLHNKFGFGRIRLTRILNEFVELSDAIYYEWLTFNDVVECLKEETGVDLGPYMPGTHAVLKQLDKQIEEEAN